MAERPHLVIAGHVDHGKSTVVGRLLADDLAATGRFVVVDDTSQ